MSKTKTETKLKCLDGMKGAIETIVAQAWERGYKYGLLEAEKKKQIKILIGGEQVYPEQEAEEADNDCPKRLQGEWEEIEGCFRDRRCSNCKRQTPCEEQGKFCINCGAKMLQKCMKKMIQTRQAADNSEGLEDD